MDHCFHNPCQNNGTCKSHHDNYTCDCSGPYKGMNCEGYNLSVATFVQFWKYLHKKTIPLCFNRIKLILSFLNSAHLHMSGKGVKSENDSVKNKNVIDIKQKIAICVVAP